MADVMRLIMADGLQIRCREKPAIRQHGVKRFDTVALALHITVAVRIAESLRRDVQHAVVEHVQDVHAGKPAARVARAGAYDEMQHRAAQRNGFELEFVVGHEITLLSP